MRSDQSRPKTGSVIITFDGDVVGTLNGLARDQIDQIVSWAKSNRPAPALTPCRRTGLAPEA